MNGGSLSRTPGFFDIIQAFLPKMPKLLLNRVFCVYTDKSGICRFIQSLLSKREFCLHKTLKEPPFGSGIFFGFLLKLLAKYSILFS